MANLYLDLCLSDIPKERIKTAANGKKYIKLIIRPRKQADKDGYDHYIAVSVPKDERLDGPIFVGRAQLKEDRVVVTAKDIQPAQAQQPAQDINKDFDLPF